MSIGTNKQQPTRKRVSLQIPHLGLITP